MANVGDILPHCTGTGTQADPYIYTTEEGFKEAIEVIQSYVEAGQSNLIFNANNQVITRVVFKCSYINGKGTTILNLLANNNDDKLIKFQSDSSGYPVEIHNMNFYNMCILVASQRQNAQYIYDDGNGTNKTKIFKNCNFTGIYKGDPHGNNISLMMSLKGSNTLAFDSCTFNFNFDCPYASTYATIAASESGEYPLEFFNCTICFSGKIIARGYGISIFRNVVLDNCVLLNKESNPLIVNDSSSYSVSINLANSGKKFTTTYNYFQMYLTGTNSGSGTFTCSHNNVLLNKSRLSIFSTITGGIQMQETDSTANDYIYDAENLANAGFLVGQTIP